jgi:hypothetical protein
VVVLVLVLQAPQKTSGAHYAWQHRIACSSFCIAFYQPET